MPTHRSYIYQLKVTLLGVRPPVWRRLLVSSEFTLGELHLVIQTAMGWTDTHMHMFGTNKGVAYGDPALDDGMLSMKNEWTVDLQKVLRKLKKTMIYEYDFGDGWEHEVLLEKQFPLVGDQIPLPECMKAVGACPPEDIGGIPGYMHFLEVINDPSHPDHEDMADWLGKPEFDPAEVDIDLINQCLKDPAAFEMDVDSAHGLSPESWKEELQQRLSEYMANHEDATEEDLNEVINAFMAQEANRVVDEFQGLNPEQMHQLLYETFSAPEVLEWNFKSVAVAQVPLLRVASALFAQLNSGKVKLTPKGNLTLAAVRKIAAASGLGPDGPADEGSKLRSEEDIFLLHITRLLAEIADLTAPTRSSLSLSPEGQRIFKGEDWPAAYHRLLETALREFNWAYLGGADEVHSLQACAPFALWLLHQFGNEWHDAPFYAEHLFNAFPSMLEEVTRNEYLSSIHIIEICVSIRLFAMLQWFGLIEQCKNPSASDDGAGPTLQVRATALFHEITRWKT